MGSDIKSRGTVVNFRGEGGALWPLVGVYDWHQTSDGLVAGVAPLSADEVGQQHDEDKCR